MIIIVVLIIIVATAALAHVVVRRGKKVLLMRTRKTDTQLIYILHQYLTILTVFCTKYSRAGEKHRVHFNSVSIPNKNASRYEVIFYQSWHNILHVDWYNLLF